MLNGDFKTQDVAFRKTMQDNAAVVIPKDIRKMVDIEPGDTVELYVVETSDKKKYIMIGGV